MSLLVQYSDSESEVESENEGKSPYKKLKLTDKSNNTEKADKTCSNRYPTLTSTVSSVTVRLE